MNPETMRNVLLVVPHADDEVIGCGGIIQALVDRNANVYVICITGEDDRSVAKPVYINGENLRVAESLKVRRFLGYKQIEHLNIPERSFAQDISVWKEIKETLQRRMTLKNIDTIFIPNHFDMNPDHRTVYDICIDAINEHVVKQVANLKEIYLYEVWGPTQATHYYLLSQKQYYYKLHAMRLYKTQMETVDYCKIIEEINNSRNISCSESLQNHKKRLEENKEFFERIDVKNISNCLTFKANKHVC